jgi:hypothetical protein
VLNSVFTSHSTGIRSADFKCVQSTFSGTPDVILKDDNHHVKVAGELKVPWIADHWLEDKFNDVDQLTCSADQVYAGARVCVWIYEQLRRDNFSQTASG